MDRKVKEFNQQSDGDLPTFIADYLNESNPQKPAAESLPQRPEPKSPKRNESSKFREIFGRIFQNIAYICIAAGIAAVLAVIIALIMNYAPLFDSSQIVVNSNSGDWVWLMLGGIMPGFIPAIQIALGVIGILILIWAWKKAVRATRKLIWRIANGATKPLAVVEPITLLILWTIGIVGVWWLADVSAFVSLVITCLGFLVLGLVSLLIMRKLVDDKLDFERTDLH